MTTEDDFQRALVEHLDDWQTRLVFADWLDERGDPRAAGYRAMGALRRAPAYFAGAARWVWLDAYWVTRYPDPVMQLAVLPDDWYYLLPTSSPSPNRTAVERPVLREALDDAATGFAALPPARQAELLAG